MEEFRIVERDRKDRLGEGLMWSERQQQLYWVDILDRQVHRLDPATGRIESWTAPEMIGWLFERESGDGFIAGLHSGFATVQLGAHGGNLRDVTPLGGPEAELPGNRMNDAFVDAEGHIWAGTMAIDAVQQSGALYRLAPDLAWRRMDAGYCIANGPVASLDGRLLYHTDSAAGRVYRYALGEDGELGPRETFIAFEPGWGAPDGMTVDTDGGIWIAHYGGGCVSRFLPDGTRDRVIALPASQITNCTFGGPGLDRLYVTSAGDGVDEPAGGALFVGACGFRGLPARRFAG